MSMASNSQLAIPLSQNTAPVFRFDCLYTHDLLRKQKRWQDGILAFHTFNKRVMVYDLTSNFIGDTHWRDSESINVGDDLRLDRGVLVEVGEARGRKDQDISEIFAKKTAQSRIQASPLPRSTLSAGQNVRVPKPLSAVLASDRGQRTKVNGPRLPSTSSVQPSAVDFESPRPLKRPRIEPNLPRRQVLGAKEVVNQVLPPNAMDRDVLPESTKSKQSSAVRRDVENTHRTSAAKKQAGSKQATDKQSTQVSTTNRTGKSKATLERTTKRVANEKIEMKQKAPLKPKKSREISADKDLSSARFSAVDRNDASPISGRSRCRLSSSTSRRKKLIFPTLPTNKGLIQTTSSPASVKSSRKGTKDKDVDDHSNPVLQPLEHSDRDVILISSQPGEQDDCNISEDEDSFITPLYRRNSVRKKRNAKNVEHKQTLQETHIDDDDYYDYLARDVSQMTGVKPVQVEVDDDFSSADLLGDTSMLAALTDSPSNVLSTVAAKTSHGQPQKNEVEGLETVKDVLLPVQEPTAMKSAIGGVLEQTKSNSPSSSPLSRNSLLDSSPEPDAAESAELTNNQSPILIPASPPTKPPQSIPKVHSPPKDDISTVLDAPDPPQPNDTSPSRPTEPPPIPQTKQFQPLAPIVLNKPNIAPAAIPNQKALPQFRPPQRTTRSTTILVSNNKRSPLRKSLTTTYPSPVKPKTNPAALARADSDEGMQTGSLVQKEFDHTGPWSREAFDLFGWTPDQSKGRVLGPVASRGCGCRAAEAAKAEVEVEVLVGRVG